MEISDLRMPEIVLERFLCISGLYFHDAYFEALELIESEWPQLSQHLQLLPYLLRFRGYCMNQLGDIEGALRAYTELIRLTPNDVQIRENLAETRERALDRLLPLAQRDEWLELQPLAEALLESAPRSVEARWWLAVSHSELGASESAAELLEDLVDEYPLRVDFQCALVTALQRAGRLGEACNRCEQAIFSLKRAGRDPGRLLDVCRELHSTPPSDS